MIPGTEIRVPGIRVCVAGQSYPKRALSCKLAVVASLSPNIRSFKPQLSDTVVVRVPWPCSLFIPSRLLGLLRTLRLLHPFTASVGVRGCEFASVGGQSSLLSFWVDCASFFSGSVKGRIDRGRASGGGLSESLER